MVLTSDTYSRPGYQQESYTVVQENYGYPQTGYSYNTSVVPGHSSGPFSHNKHQHQPMGDIYGRPHGHNSDHNHNHGHKYQHQNEHGMTTYSAAELGFVGNPCPPTGHGYGHGPSHGNGYGPNHVGGPGKFGKLYSAFKEADD